MKQSAAKTLGVAALGAAFAAAGAGAANAAPRRPGRHARRWTPSPRRCRRTNVAKALPGAGQALGQGQGALAAGLAAAEPVASKLLAGGPTAAGRRAARRPAGPGSAHPRPPGERHPARLTRRPRTRRWGAPDAPGSRPASACAPARRRPGARSQAVPAAASCPPRAAGSTALCRAGTAGPGSRQESRKITRIVVAEVPKRRASAAHTPPIMRPLRGAGKGGHVRLLRERGAYGGHDRLSGVPHRDSTLRDEAGKRRSTGRCRPWESSGSRP